MEYILYKDYKFSRLVLGTVQLGIPYGIGHQDMKPEKEEAIKILNTALEGGINTVDTARSYGDSEAIIGEFNFPLNRQMVEITKFKVHFHNFSSRHEVKKEAFDSVYTSLDKLHKKRLPVCLFHKEMDQPMEWVLDNVVPVISDLKQSGIIDLGGISVAHPGEVEAFYDLPVIDVLQVPFNVFDQRILANGRLEKLQQRGKMVLARSIFLKGLLFTNPEKLDGFLREITQYLKSLNRIASQSNLTIAQIAMAYARDTPGISGLVVGAENADQVKQNLELFNGPGLDPEVKEIIEKSFSNIPEPLITPALWAV